VADVAGLSDPKLWADVQAALSRGPVEIILADGAYPILLSIRMNNLGDETNPLTIRAAAPGHVTFRENDAEKTERNHLFDIKNCRNLVFRHLPFPRPALTGIRIAIFHCRDLVIDHCVFT